MPIKGIEIKQIMTMLYENVSTRAANKVKFHSCLRGSLLRLEEHGFGFTAARAELVGSGKRRVISNVLSHTSSIANLAAELILVNTI